MRSSVRDGLRRRDREDVLRLPPEERVELALRLGERCVRIFADAQGLPVETARERILAARERRRFRKT